MDKRGLELETLGKWLIGLVLLIILILGMIILKEKGVNALRYLRDLLRG